MSEDDVIKRPGHITYEGRFNEDKDADRSVIPGYLTPPDINL